MLLRSSIIFIFVSIKNTDDIPMYKISFRLLLAVMCLYAGLLTASAQAIPADRDTARYFPLLREKRIAVFSNHTGMVSADKHLLDVLVENRFNVTAIFSPEHGFRGKADLWRACE